MGEKEMIGFGYRLDGNVVVGKDGEIYPEADFVALVGGEENFIDSRPERAFYIPNNVPVDVKDADGLVVESPAQAEARIKADMYDAAYDVEEATGRYHDADSIRRAVFAATGLRPPQ